AARDQDLPEPLPRRRLLGESRVELSLVDVAVQHEQPAEREAVPLLLRRDRRALRLDAQVEAVLLGKRVAQVDRRDQAAREQDLAEPAALGLLLAQRVVQLELADQ